MKKLFLAALVAFGLSSGANAQMTSTTQREMPNGNTRTTSRIETAGGTASTTAVTRDGRRVSTIRRQTDRYGNRTVVRRQNIREKRNMRRTQNMHGYRYNQGRRYGSSNRKCTTHYRNGHRVVRCVTRR